MRSEIEIARAHDVLVAVINREVPIVLGHDGRRALSAACDALCWVLDHRAPDCPGAFAENLAKLEQEAKKAGFQLRLKGGGE